MELKYVHISLTVLWIITISDIAMTAGEGSKVVGLPCEPMDVIFLVDTSASISSSLFMEYSDFLGDAITDIKSLSRGTRIGVIAFNTFAKSIHKFSDRQTPAAVFDIIDTFRTRVPCGLSFIDTALEKATDMFVYERRRTGDAKRVVILLSDGNMTQRSNKAKSYYLSLPLRLLLKLRAEVFVVSVGDNVDIGALSYIIKDQANKQVFTFGIGGTFLDFLEKSKRNCQSTKKEEVQIPKLVNEQESIN